MKKNVGSENASSAIASPYLVGVVGSADLNSDFKTNYLQEGCENIEKIHGHLLVEIHYKLQLQIESMR